MTEIENKEGYGPIEKRYNNIMETKRPAKCCTTCRDYIEDSGQCITGLAVNPTDTCEEYDPKDAPKNHEDRIERVKQTYKEAKSCFTCKYEELVCILTGEEVEPQSVCEEHQFFERDSKNQ